MKVRDRMWVGAWRGTGGTQRSGASRVVGTECAEAGPGSGMQQRASRVPSIKTNPNVGGCLRVEGGGAPRAEGQKECELKG